MKTSLKMPNLATVLALVIVAPISVQCLIRRSPKFGDTLSQPVNSPNLEIDPRDTLSSRIEYRIGEPELSPKTEDPVSEDHLAGHVPDSYRIIPRKPEPPRIEMQLMKGHVSQTGANWIASMEYIFSDNYENEQSKSDGNGAVSERPREESTTKNPKSGLGFRTIFDVPGRQCPSGYQLDYRKQCRKIVQFWYGD